MSSLFTLLVAGSAIAQPPGGSPVSPPGSLPPGMANIPYYPEQATEPEGEPTWYGWQILMTDLAAAGILVASADSDSDNSALLLFTGAIYLGASPVIHGYHNQGRKSAISLGMRVGLPVLGGFLGYYSAGDCFECHSTHGLFEAIGGTLIGVAAASVIDIAFLSRESRPSAGRAEYAWTPRLGVSDSGFTAGVGGWF